MGGPPVFSAPPSRGPLLVPNNGSNPGVLGGGVPPVFERPPSLPPSMTPRPGQFPVPPQHPTQQLQQLQQQRGIAPSLSFALPTAIPASHSAPTSTSYSVPPSISYSALPQPISIQHVAHTVSTSSTYAAPFNPTSGIAPNSSSTSTSLPVSNPSSVPAIPGDITLVWADEEYSMVRKELSFIFLTLTISSFMNFFLQFVKALLKFYFIRNPYNFMLVINILLHYIFCPLWCDVLCCVMLHWVMIYYIKLCRVVLFWFLCHFYSLYLSIIILFVTVSISNSLILRQNFSILIVVTETNLR